MGGETSIGGVIAWGREIRFHGCPGDRGLDVLCDDMHTRAHIAEGGSWSTALAHDVGYASSQGLDGTKPGGARGVMDSRPALPIFLVVKVQGNRFGESQFSERCCVGHHEPVFAECDILYPELLGAGPNSAPWHGVFTYSE